MQKKKGISLIVLVITIIVMIILAAAIILSLNNAGIIGNANQAVKKTDLANVQDMASLKWSDAYLERKRTQEELYDAVIEGLKKEKVDTSKYLITVTTDGVDVYEFPEWISSIVDGVPIPKGFVASSATGENTRTGGLVIYEGTGTIDDTNVENAKRSKNQYVWVPVDDFDNFKRIVFSKYDELSDILGDTDKIWEQTPSTNVNFEGMVINPNYKLCVEDEIEFEGSTEEQAEATCSSQYDKEVLLKSSDYTSETTTKEVRAMYESVKKYGGFYIARYEAALDIRSTSSTQLTKGNLVYSMMGKKPYIYINWSENAQVETGGAVEVARSIYPEANQNLGVVSTLTYGVQWDTILQWWLDTKTIDSVYDSSEYGNYIDSHISSSDFNANSQYSTLGTNDYVNISSTFSKSSWSSNKYLFTTGAVKKACIKNIYDMAGNVMELTMEGYSCGYRELRGGCFNSYGDNLPVSNRHTKYLSKSNSEGFRVALYIKK